jgi:lactoylglutathione lyase
VGSDPTLGREFHNCHIAFNVSLSELLAAGERLNAAGIQTQNFAGEKTTEPSVIGWMPSAQVYFRDRDGHSLEFITLLDESAEPEFVGSLSEWKKRGHAT